MQHDLTMVLALTFEGSRGREQPACSNTGGGVSKAKLRKKGKSYMETAKIVPRASWRQALVRAPAPCNRIRTTRTKPSCPPSRPGRAGLVEPLAIRTAQSVIRNSLDTPI